ncbi:hypothetical protein [Litchfieldia alkalitelluris]|uniref:hypothetical protein n=1 Tax=Litchfieldia alkalitelluris TaxID=304268 RepID=UPI000997749C|nr:hypothetical protein [Litchfieldia alkalitelluris]
MNNQFTSPKGFGEILDHTFRLAKNRFKDFFMIMIILVGPIYLLQAIIQMFAGTNLFRETGTGGAWYEQIMTSFEDPAYIGETPSLVGELGAVFVGLLSLILLPVAQAAIMYAINHIKFNEEYTVGSVIKRAFSRFWPIIGSSILFGLILFGLIAVPLIVITTGGFILSTANPMLAIGLGIIIFLGSAVGIGFLVTKWSFYFGSVVIDEEAPGLTRSWHLTFGRTWILMGIFIIFYLIISSVSFGIELTFGAIFGNSVLFTLIVNLVSLITTMILSVGYTIMYLDLKTRHDGDDLKEMIEQYEIK